MDSQNVFYIFIHVLPKNIRFTIHIVKFSAEFKGRLSRFFFIDFGQAQVPIQGSFYPFD